MLNLLTKIAKLATVMVVGIYTLIWALSPYVANHFLSQYLETQKLTLDAESTIRYNPFLSKLTIDTLTITKATNKAERVLELSALRLELSAHRLLFDQVSISEFIIDGLYLAVNKEADLLRVAGIQIPASSHVDGESSETSELEKNTQSSYSPFQLVMAKMTLKNTMIDIIEEGQQHQLYLNDVNINEVEATQAIQNLSLTLVGNLDGAEITLSAIAAMKEGLGTIDIEVVLTEIDINKFSHLAVPHIENTEGVISYSAEHNIELTAAGIGIVVTDLTINSQNLEANKNGLQFNLGEQELKTKRLSLQAPADAGMTIITDAELSLKDINIYNKTKAQVLMAIKGVSLDDVGIRSEDGQYKVTVNNVAVLDSFFSDNIDNEIPALTQFSSLSINNTVLTNNALEINTIELAGLKASAQMDKDKALQNLIISVEELSAALREGDAEVESEIGNKAFDEVNSGKVASSEEVTDYPKFAIKLNSFNLTDNAGIHFSDRSVSPTYNRNITVTHLSAGPFDTQAPNQKSMIKIKGKSNKYASFYLTVNAKPFLEIPRYHLEGQFDELDLPGLSGYIKTALGYEINSGQLDLGINVTLVGSRMDGESQVLLRGIELTALDNYEEDSSSIQTSIPFNAALGMLKDGDGNVELDLPLSGDINSPSFGLSGFLTLLVKQATIIGAREYLAVTLVPYAGLVTIVVVADKYMLKVQINNLDYPPKEVAVPTDHDVFLSSFSALLNDNPDLHVKLCGVSSAADIGKEKGSDISSKDDIKVLKVLAIKRAVNFKEYMVREKGIDSSRLLLCSPKIDSDIDAIPHIRFET